MYKNYCNKKFDENDFIILTLPTPKQEEFAELIRKNSKYFKIICIGGAMVMASGEEKPIPIYLEKNGLEFLWRLRTDTNRRLKRLIVTFVYYIFGWFDTLVPSGIRKYPYSETNMRLRSMKHQGWLRT